MIYVIQYSEWVQHFIYGHISSRYTQLQHEQEALLRSLPPPHTQLQQLSYRTLSLHRLHYSITKSNKWHKYEHDCTLTSIVLHYYTWRKRKVPACTGIPSVCICIYTEGISVLHWPHIVTAWPSLDCTTHQQKQTHFQYDHGIIVYCCVQLNAAHTYFGIRTCIHVYIRGYTHAFTNWVAYVRSN